MKNTVLFHEFAEGFRTSSYYNSFTREALRIMFDWYEDLEVDMGCEIEYDVCAMASDWDECTFDELLELCGLDAGSVDPDDVDFDESGGAAWWIEDARILVYVPLIDDLTDYLASHA